MSVTVLHNSHRGLRLNKYDQHYFPVNSLASCKKSSLLLSLNILKGGGTVLVLKVLIEHRCVMNSKQDRRLFCLFGMIKSFFLAFQNKKIKAFPVDWTGTGL